MNKYYTQKQSQMASKLKSNVSASATSGGFGPINAPTAPHTQYDNTTNDGQEEKPEWTAIFVDGEVTDLDHVILPLKHGLLGKDTRLGTKKLRVRIKPGSRLAIRTINAWNNPETEYQTVRSDGWELDIDVLEAMTEVRQNSESQLYGPCIYVDLSKLPMNDESANQRLGFWFQVSDIEWKLVEGS